MEFIKGIFGNKEQVTSTGDIWCVSRNGAVVLVVTDVPASEFVGMSLYSKVIDITRGMYSSEKYDSTLDKLLPLIRQGGARQITWAKLNKS